MESTKKTGIMAELKEFWNYGPDYKAGMIAGTAILLPIVAGVAGTLIYGALINSTWGWNIISSAMVAVSPAVAMMLASDLSLGDLFKYGPATALGFAPLAIFGGVALFALNV